MPKILLPIDIEHPHDDLIDQLDKLISMQSSTFHLLYIKEDLPSFEHTLGSIADFPDDWRNQLVAKVEAKFQEIKSNLANRCVAVTSEIANGFPAATINQVAVDEGFDLIAMMPGSHSRVEEHLIGGTTGRVLAHASNTVLVIRPTNAKLERVVIAVDGSPTALEAAQTAVALFQLAERNVHVTLVNVVSVLGIYKYIAPVQFVASIEDNLMMSGEVALTEAQKQLDHLGVKSLDIQLKNGDPAGEIIKLADSLKADLIVAGAQGRSAIEKMFLGSVSNRLATHAKCSTVIIR